MLVDLVTNDLIFLSLDGFTSYSIDLYHDIYEYPIVWPRTITSPVSSSTSISSDILTIYIGEIFGKIWKVQLNTTILYENHLAISSSHSKLLSQSIIEPILLLDLSNYPASLEIRNLIRNQKFLDERSELIFPDILD